MGNHLGYVVIEYDQASHEPDVLEYSFTQDIVVARLQANDERSRVAMSGRHETYTIAEVIELGDGDD